MSLRDLLTQMSNPTAYSQESAEAIVEQEVYEQLSTADLMNCIDDLPGMQDESLENARNTLDNFEKYLKVSAAKMSLESNPLLSKAQIFEVLTEAGIEPYGGSLESAEELTDAEYYELSLEAAVGFFDKLKGFFKDLVESGKNGGAKLTAQKPEAVSAQLKKISKQLSSVQVEDKEVPFYSARLVTIDDKVEIAKTVSSLSNYSKLISEYRTDGVSVVLAEANRLVNIFMKVAPEVEKETKGQTIPDSEKNKLVTGRVSKEFFTKDNFDVFVQEINEKVKEIEGKIKNYQFPDSVTVESVAAVYSGKGRVTFTSNNIVFPGFRVTVDKKSTTARTHSVKVDSSTIDELIKAFKHFDESMNESIKTHSKITENVTNETTKLFSKVKGAEKLPGFDALFNYVKNVVHWVQYFVNLEIHFELIGTHYTQIRALIGFSENILKTHKQ